MATPKRNIRLAWYARNIGEMKSNGAIVDEATALFKISATTARKELAEVYERLAAFDRANTGAARSKVLEALWRLAAMAEAGLDFRAAVVALDKIAKVSGLHQPDRESISDGAIADDGMPTPKAGTVRDRIRQLARDPSVRERAKKLGLDMDTIDVLD